MPQPEPSLPAVTVIVVSYNHFAFLPQLLESIEGQSVQPQLTILCDDASTDPSADVLRQFAARTSLSTVLRLSDHNRGLTRTLNAALALVDTPYFTYISGDDYMLPGHLATQLGRLAGDPDLAFVYGDAIRVDEVGLELDQGFFARHDRREQDVDDFDSLLRRNWIPAASVVASTEAVRAVGGYDEALFFEDHDLWLRIASSRRFAGAGAPSVAFRELPSSLGHRRFRDDDPGWQWAKVRIRSRHLGRDRRTDRVVARMMLPSLVTLAARGTERSELVPYLRMVARADPRPATAAYLVAGHLPGGLLRTVASRRRRAR